MEVQPSTGGVLKLHVPEWAKVEPDTGERHLPIYFLVDASASMVGTPIASVCEGLEEFQCEILADPFARDVVRIGVITFGETARFVTDGLVVAESFLPLELTACSTEVTRLDLAFQLLRQSLDLDINRPIVGGPKGDWRPVVLVLLDGRPTDEHGQSSDEWQTIRDDLITRPRGWVKPAAIAAFGLGLDVDKATLQQIGTTGAAFNVGTSEAPLVALFRFISQSIAYESIAPVMPSDKIGKDEWFEETRDNLSRRRSKPSKRLKDDAT